MKLNLAKCSFEVSFEKFMGFKVSQRGIKANREKIPAHGEAIPVQVQRITTTNKQSGHP
jgi:hypothetical protein